MRRGSKRPKLTAADRIFWVWLSRIWSDWRSALAMVKPERVIARYRKGFRLFWTWRVRRGQAGRPVVSGEVRDLIRRMSRENPRWGAPRIHREFLKRVNDVGVFDNHLRSPISVDSFTVPAIRYQELHAFLGLVHDRRRIVHVDVTAHPTRSGPPSNCERRFRSSRSRSICCATGMESSATVSKSRSKTRRSGKCCRRLGRRGSARRASA